MAVYLSKQGKELLGKRIEKALAELDAIRAEKEIAYTASGDTWHDNPGFNALEQAEHRKAVEEGFAGYQAGDEDFAAEGDGLARPVHDGPSALLIDLCDHEADSGRADLHDGDGFSCGKHGWKPRFQHITPAALFTGAAG